MLNEDRLIRDKIKDFRLLLEYVDRNTIIDAIQNKYVLKIYYAGDNTTNRGFRTIEPYTLGVHSGTSNIVLRAWQQAGASDTPYGQGNRNKGIRNSGEGGAWRMFRLDGITSAYPFPNKHFANDGKVRPKYRTDGGDQHMTTIIAAVKVSGKDDTYTIDGMQSIDDPTTFGITLGRDKDAETVRKFYQDSQKLAKYYTDPSNQEQILKKRVVDFYNMLKQNGRDPIRYVVTDKDGVLWYQKIGTRGYNNLKDEDIVGNLNTLFRKQTGATTFKIDQQFVDKVRKGLEDDLRNSAEL